MGKSGGAWEFRSRMKTKQKSIWKGENKPAVNSVSLRGHKQNRVHRFRHNFFSSFYIKNVLVDLHGC